MQGPRGDEPLRGLDGYEQMVNTFAQNAKAYWRMWGPLGGQWSALWMPGARIMERGDVPSFARLRPLSSLPT